MAPGSSRLVALAGCIAGFELRIDADPSFQNRGLLESYASTAMAAHHGRHDFSFGADFVRTGLRENFQYTITDPSQFDSDVLPVFTFAQSAVGYEGSAYVQDHLSAGPFTANSGIRWDYYDLLLDGSHGVRDSRSR